MVLFMNWIADAWVILLLLFLWLLPALLAISGLRRSSRENAVARVLWVAVILFCPLVGALVYLLLFADRNAPPFSDK